MRDEILFRWQCEPADRHSTNPGRGNPFHARRTRRPTRSRYRPYLRQEPCTPSRSAGSAAVQ